MKAVSADGAASGTYPLLKRRITPLVLVCSLLSFTAGEFFLPPPVQAVSQKSAQTTGGNSAQKTVTQKKASNKTPKKAVATKKKRLYVRTLIPDEECAELRERGISSGFGLRAISRKSTRMHKGIDVPAPKDSKIMAFNDGEIVFAGNKNGYGKTVIVKQIDGREALYAHMNAYTVSIGDKVKRGDQIGNVGRTGRATGYHLHFEIIDEGVNLNPAQHVWHGSELVLGPSDLDPGVEGQTHLASPTTRTTLPLY